MIHRFQTLPNQLALAFLDVSAKMLLQELRLRFGGMVHGSCL